VGEEATRVLLVCESSAGRSLLADALERCDIAVEPHFSASVREALVLLRDMAFDLILVDTGRDSDSFADILQHNGHVPAILLAGPENRQAALEAIRRNSCDVLVKDADGFYLEVLPLKIGNLLRASGPRPPLQEGLSEFTGLTRSLLEHSPNMIFINAMGRIVYANRMCTKVIGYDRDYFYSPDFDFFSLIAPESIAVVKAAYSRHMHGEDVEPYEYTLLTRDGRRIECIMSTTLIQYRGRRSILGIITDISHRKRVEEQLLKARDELELRVKARTAELMEVNKSLKSEIAERIKAEQALKESEVHFKTIFENAGGAIFIADTETGRILECNTKAEALTGRKRADIVGRSFLQLHPPDRVDEFNRKFRHHAEQGHGVDFEIELQHRDGRRIPVWLSTQIMTIQGKKVMMGLFIDITERKRAEEERAHLMDALVERNAELESIIHVISHDFRTPLVTIEGFSGELDHSCRLLRKLLDEREGDFKTSGRPVITRDIPEAVDLIKASTAKLDSLLEGMLTLSGPGHVGLQKDTLDMNAMIGDIIKTMSFQAKELGARFNVGSLPCCVGDSQQINQVFSNLLANALNYLDPDRPGVISVSGRSTDGSVVYCVEDNGIGIDSHNLPNIFKVFYRVDPEKSEGSGIGLAIVRRIVNRHNGKVWVESEPGQGSRFFVSLPCS